MAVRGLYVFPLFSYNKPRGPFFNIAFGPDVQVMVNSGARQNRITTTKNMFSLFDRSQCYVKASD